MVETIEREGVLLGIIARHGEMKPGVRFLTPGHLSQQLAFMSHPRGKRIEPHVHAPVPRGIQYTQEVLVIRRGKLRVDFFDESQTYLESRILEDGDAIVLVRGGHGFEVLEDLEMVEVKQGPYAGEQDKVRFAPPPFEPRTP